MAKATKEEMQAELKRLSGLSMQQFSNSFQNGVTKATQEIQNKMQAVGGRVKLQNATLGDAIAWYFSQHDEIDSDEEKMVNEVLQKFPELKDKKRKIAYALQKAQGQFQ